MLRTQRETFKCAAKLFLSNNSKESEKGIQKTTQLTT